MEESVENLTVPFLEVSQSCHIGRILVPVDGSECSFNALEFAVDLAAKYDSEICLVHVIPTRYLNLWLMPVECLFHPEGFFIPPDVLQRMKDESEHLLRSALKLVQSAGINSYTRVGQGRPANEIAQIAEEENVDLVVIGSHSPGLLARLIFGSVSDDVVHGAPCPVLVVKDLREDSGEKMVGERDEFQG